VFVLDVGELERFCPSIGNHGAKWVNAVLQRDLANDPELNEARDFVAQVRDSLGRHDNDVGGLILSCS
jgi:hypothetical protein